MSPVEFVVFLSFTLVAALFIMTGLFMKLYWWLSSKKQNLVQKIPYYKEPVPYVISILLSFVISFAIIYILLE